MFKLVRYRIDRWKAKRAIAKFEKKMREEILATKKAHPQAKESDLLGEYQLEYYLLLDRVSELDSAYWTSTADEAHIPIPSHTNIEYWDKTSLEKWILTTYGIDELRRKVRAEAKDRDSLWLPRITAVFAVIAGLYAAGQFLWSAWHWWAKLP